MFNTLIKHIDNRQIVLLGESAHGIMEQNQLRIDLIKILNKEQGFKHLLIESVKRPICHDNLLRVHSIDYLKNFLHEVYHTEEMVSLVDFVKESKIQIDGFEIEGIDLEKYFELKKVSGRDSRTFRDKTMFNNFKKLMDHKIKSDKVIIWGHNAHMMKKVSNGAYRDKVFGEYVNETYGDKSIVVGQYTGSGEIEHMPYQKENSYKKRTQLKNISSIRLRE